MRKYRRPIQVIYVTLVAISIWFIGPVLAGGGDPVIAKQAWPMIDQGALLIDVRTAEEFAAGHITGAINIPWQETDKLMDAIGPDLQRQVVVYCRSGNRSTVYCNKLRKQGFESVYNLKGGVLAWQRAELPLTKTG